MENGHSDTLYKNERKTRWVVYLTAATMALEIGFGRYANSMALVAQGWHMSTHVFSIGMAWFAYYFARKYAEHGKLSFQKKKVVLLGGFSSAILLQIVAITIALESVERLQNPLPIRFGEAVSIACLGLAVNFISAVLLRHDKEHGDYNIRAAYLHVVADVFTGVMTIAALLAGLLWKLSWLDSVSGFISSIVITIWAIRLIRNSGRDLIEFNRK